MLVTGGVRAASSPPSQIITNYKTSLQVSKTAFPWQFAHVTSENISSHQNLIVKVIQGS